MQTNPTRLYTTAGAEEFSLSERRLILRVREGPDFGMIRELDKLPFTIGADNEADLELSDQYVSKIHAALKASGQRIMLVDENSTNGTFLDNIRISKPEPVSAGASFIVGKTLLRLEEETRPVKVPPIHDSHFHGMMAAGKNMRQIAGILKKVAPTMATVLFIGETGVGKEVAARALVAASHRSDKPFEVVNCAAIPEGLAESILFGHEKGAFTGAVSTVQGAFERADGGTLFLDEIGDLDLKLQPKLLRVLEDGIVQRVGGAKRHAVSVRILAATSKNISKETASGRFREDLYYRISMVPVRIPPLRERKEEIPVLSRAILESEAKRHGVRPAQLSPEAMETLMQYGFPGNIRELLNILSRALLLCDCSKIEKRHIAFLDEQIAGTESSVEDERRKIIQALEMFDGNRQSAAKWLGMARSTLYRKLAAYGIKDSKNENES